MHPRSSPSVIYSVPPGDNEIIAENCYDQIWYSWGEWYILRQFFFALYTTVPHELLRQSSRCSAPAHSILFPIHSNNRSQLKLEVSKVIGAEGKYLRLIAAGKMLSPDESIVKQFGLSENCYVHCVVTAAPPRLRLPSLSPVEQAEEEVCGFLFIFLLPQSRSSYCAPLCHKGTVSLGLGTMIDESMQTAGFTYVFIYL